MQGTPRISIVVPVYNEEAVLPEFHRRLKNVLKMMTPPPPSEVIYVDDGSRDRSLSILRELSREDADVRVICLSRNFGHQFAITAGLDHATGEAVVTIDGDLQDPPELIPKMLRKRDEGYEVVYGVREKRAGENPFKLITAKIFYRLIRFLSDTDLPVDAGDFRLLDRKIVDVLKTAREENRYLRGLVSWAGFSQTGLPYKRDPRYAGHTKFTPRKMLRFAVDGLLSFSDRPLKMSAILGFVITAASFLATLWILIGRLIFPDRAVSGWTSMILAVLFMGGIQLISLGILGLYLGRQYREVKKRPLYVISKKLGFKDE